MEMRPLAMTLKNYNMWACVYRGSKRRCWGYEKCTKMSGKEKLLVLELSLQITKMV